MDTGLSKRRLRLAQRSAEREWAATTIQRWYGSRYHFHVVPSAVKIQRVWRVHRMVRRYRPEGAAREWPPTWARPGTVERAAKLQFVLCEGGLCLRPYMTAWRARSLIMATHVSMALREKYLALRAEHKEAAASPLGGGDRASVVLFEALQRAMRDVATLNNMKASAQTKHERFEFHKVRLAAQDSLARVERGVAQIAGWMAKTEATEGGHEPGKDWCTEMCKYCSRSDTMECVAVWQCYLGALFAQAGEGRDLEVDTGELVARLDGWLGCGNRGHGFGNPVVHLVICAFRFESCARARAVVDQYRATLHPPDWVCIVETLDKYKCACVQCERQCVYDLLNAGGDIDAMTSGETESESMIYNFKGILCAGTCGAWLLSETKNFSK